MIQQPQNSRENVYRGLCRLTCGLFVGSLVWLTGCSHPTVSVSEVLNHARCSGLARGIEEIQIHDLAKVRGVQMLAAPAKADSSAKEQPTRDADAPGRLFAVSNGEQPTPGYGFELLEAVAVKEEIQLRYTWRTPAKDAVLAQVITSPCSVVALTPESTTELPMPQISAVSAWLHDELLGRVAISPSN